MGSTDGVLLQLSDRNKAGWVDDGKYQGGVKNPGGKKVIGKPYSSG
jgi:hypothetical protein